jgi:hypothetical protein
MTVAEVDLAAIERELISLEAWAHKCHQASLQIVRSGIVAPSRVARGACMGVGAQHSWVVLGDDCYDNDATIIDPTLWSYESRVDGIWVGSYRDGLHIPFGKGLIWAWGRPPAATGEVVELTPSKPLSKEALKFLELLGPLDDQGWRMLAHAPVEGWPAGEIFEAMCDTGMEARIPIDLLGMTTERNPKGLYR